MEEQPLYFDDNDDNASEDEGNKASAHKVYIFANINIPTFFYNQHFYKQH